MVEFTSITPEIPVTITDGEVVTPKQTLSSAGSSGRTTISQKMCPTNAIPSGTGHKSLLRARLLTSASNSWKEGNEAAQQKRAESKAEEKTEEK